jgi:mono/diheme cytochrome c family protein
MKTEDRLLTKDSCDKGYNLYVLNCAACHNDTVKGKAVIPDFTYQQLENYEIRFLNEQHIIQLDERKLSQEELSFILTFLRYKKKNKA